MKRSIIAACILLAASTASAQTNAKAAPEQLKTNKAPVQESTIPAPGAKIKAADEPKPVFKPMEEKAPAAESKVSTPANNNKEEKKVVDATATEPKGMSIDASTRGGKEVKNADRPKISTIRSDNKTNSVTTPPPAKVVVADN